MPDFQRMVAIDCLASHHVARLAGADGQLLPFVRTCFSTPSSSESEQLLDHNQHWVFTDNSKFNLETAVN